MSELKYTLAELNHLRNIRLMGFQEHDMLDDFHTNEYCDFELNTEIFLQWLESMEVKGKIPELLRSMPQEKENRVIKSWGLRKFIDKN